METYTKLDENNIKKILEQYLLERGIEFSHLNPKKHNNNKKTPDYKLVLSSNDYLCELKSPELVIDLETGVYKFSTTNSKLRTFIHKAVKQFIEFNPDHRCPWVVVFISSHFQLNWKNLTDAIQGVVVHGSTATANFSQTDIVKRTNEDVAKVDLYIWLQVNGDSKMAYQATFILNDRSLFKDESQRIVTQLNKKKLSSMDNLLTLSSFF
jgi:hypothetical protein